MNTQGQLGSIAGILLVIFILIGAVSASVIMTETQISSDDDLNALTNEIVDELCSYLQIKQIIGKYHTIHGEQKINQIAILIKPYITQTIDISHMTIELCDGAKYSVLCFNGTVESFRSGSLFEHSAWGTLANDTYGVLATIDDDNSLITSSVLNKNTDIAFLIIQLPDDTALSQDTQLTVTLRPTPGIGRTVLLETPLPIKNVVSLYE